MRIYAGVTDYDWFDYLRGLSACDEVNFWQPSASRGRNFQRSVVLSVPWSAFKPFACISRRSSAERTSELA